MPENKAADNLSMIEEDEQEQSISVMRNDLIILRIPEKTIIEGNILKLSVKDALEIIANLAVQVALGEN